MLGVKEVIYCTELLKLAHTTHLGKDIIQSNVKQIWFWQSLRNYLRVLYQPCEACQIEKRAKN